MGYYSLSARGSSAVSYTVEEYRRIEDALLVLNCGVQPSEIEKLTPTLRYDLLEMYRVHEEIKAEQYKRARKR